MSRADVDFGAQLNSLLETVCPLFPDDFHAGIVQGSGMALWLSAHEPLLHSYRSVLSWFLFRGVEECEWEHYASPFEFKLNYSVTGFLEHTKALFDFAERVGFADWEVKHAPLVPSSYEGPDWFNYVAGLVMWTRESTYGPTFYHTLRTTYDKHVDNTYMPDNPWWIAVTDILGALPRGNLDRLIEHYTQLVDQKFTEYKVATECSFDLYSVLVGLVFALEGDLEGLVRNYNFSAKQKNKPLLKMSELLANPARITGLLNNFKEVAEFVGSFDTKDEVLQSAPVTPALFAHPFAVTRKPRANSWPGAMPVQEPDLAAPASDLPPLSLGESAMQLYSQLPPNTPLDPTGQFVCVLMMWSDGATRPGVVPVEQYVADLQLNGKCG